jgi:hypothetical protein
MASMTEAKLYTWKLLRRRRKNERLKIQFKKLNVNLLRFARHYLRDHTNHQTIGWKNLAVIASFVFAFALI